MSTTITLSKPVSSAGREIRELTLREPLGSDIAVCGYPFSIKEDGSVHPQAGPIQRYIARLSGLTSGAAGNLAAADYQQAMAAVLSFFGQPVSAPAPETTEAG